jgi:hypothetical protein
MAINGTGSDQQISGVVRSVNDKGLKLEGFDSWFNVSRFAVGVVLPERGEAVTVTLDKAGFLRAVAPVDGAPLTPAPNAVPGAPSGQRERTITRLAVLKAAAEFSAARPALKSGEVLAIAASWERWINREQDNALELTDAF